MPADLISARAVVRMLRKDAEALRTMAILMPSKSAELMVRARQLNGIVPAIRRMAARARKRKAKRDG